MKNIIKPNMTFNVSLFREGMRQLKIGGIIYAIICALIGTVGCFESVERSDYYTHKSLNVSLLQSNTDRIFFTVIAVAIFIMAACTILYSFLRNAKARDFYCSLPHSPGTIWLSFTLSIMAWTSIGILAGSVAMLPFILATDASFCGVWFMSLIQMLAIMIFGCGVVALAASLTGKMIPYVVTGLGILMLPDFVTLALKALDLNYYSRYRFFESDAKMSITAPVYSYFVGLRHSSDFICVDLTAKYLITGVVYLALAAFFMNMRTGDASGRAFSGKGAHVLSLTVVNSCIMCCAAFLFTDVATNILVGIRNLPYECYVDYSVEGTVCVLLVIASIFAYWISELIMTFDFKHSYRVLKALPIPLIAAVAVVCIGWADTSIDFHQSPKPNDIKSVVLTKNYNLGEDLSVYRQRETYGRAVTESYEFKNEKLNQYISGQLSDIMAQYNKDWTEYDDAEANNDPICFKINLKNGKTIIRNIPLKKNFDKILTEAITSDSCYMEQFLAMPEIDTINLHISDTSGVSEEDCVGIYNTFRSEFDAMTDEQKMQMIKDSAFNRGYYDYNDYGTIYNEYEVDDDTTVCDDGSFVYENVYLVDKTVNQGEYNSRMLSFGSESVKDASVFSIDFEGYLNGHKYDSNYYFRQSYTLNHKQFPKTVAAIVAAANKHMSVFTDMKGNDGKERNTLNISAYYYGMNNSVNMEYEFIDKDIVELCKKGLYSFNNYNYGEEYDEKTDTYYAVQREEINIDGKACVEQLMDDGAKSQTVDFNKPFCLVYLWINEKNYNLFIQTDCISDIYAEQIEAAVKSGNKRVRID